MPAEPATATATASASVSVTVTGPRVSAGALTLAYPDPEEGLLGVRLQQEAGIPADRLEFGWAAGAWRLTVGGPDVDRMEYLLELTHVDGSTESVTDPTNPLRVRGAFGEKSVVELPGYQQPRWLDQAAPAGQQRTVAVTARSLGEELRCIVWSPAGVRDDTPLPLLVVHDGPEYAELAGLTTYLSASIQAGELPAARAALLPPGPRDERYSLDRAYTRALCLAVLPRLHDEVATTTTTGMGASLGALAMLFAQRQHDGTFDALFLQSGSFFHARHDAQERRFPRFDRIARGVDAILRSSGHPSPVPTVMTCGTAEENLANNRIMARALAAQGYDVTLQEVRDAHNYTAWRDAFDPWLTRLLREVHR